jgi:hypothetical protein
MTDYYGIREPADNTDLTAEAGTNTTTVICSFLSETTDDAYNGYYYHNLTRSTGVLITNYVGLTKTITVPVITAQTAGDTFYIINPWRVETLSGTVRSKGLSLTNRSKGLEVVK